MSYELNCDGCKNPLGDMEVAITGKYLSYSHIARVKRICPSEFHLCENCAEILYLAFPLAHQ